MRKYVFLPLIAFLITPVNGARAQSTPEPSNTAPAKTVVVTAEPQPSSVIAVPPIKGVTVTLRSKAKLNGEAMDLRSWSKRVTEVNGLESPGQKPWHIVVTYDQFDEDGDNVNSGVYEEFWAGPKKYKRIYKSDTLKQTEYATAGGLFRVGDQKWADQATSAVREEIVAPFAFVSVMREPEPRSEQRSFGDSKLDCVFVFYGNSQMISSEPPRYCFEPGTAVLRYSRGDGWFQTAYNEIAQFQGHNVAREVVVTDAGKPYLKLHVDSLDPISNVNDADFTPPEDAVGPIGGRITGVRTEAIKMVAPIWPRSLNGKGQHWTAHVQVVIGKDGHVLAAHMIDGPPDAAKSFEEAALQWVYKPFLVLGEPVEVESQIVFMK